MFIESKKTMSAGQPKCPVASLTLKAQSTILSQKMFLYSIRFLSLAVSVCSSPPKNGSATASQKKNFRRKSSSTKKITSHEACAVSGSLRSILSDRIYFRCKRGVTKTFPQIGRKNTRICLRLLLSR